MPTLLRYKKATKIIGNFPKKLQLKAQQINQSKALHVNNK